MLSGLKSYSYLKLERMKESVDTRFDQVD